MYSAGHIAIDPRTGRLTGETVAEQTAQVIANLRAVLGAAGSSLDRVLKTTCFLVDIADFPEFDRAYAAAFGEHRGPRFPGAYRAGRRPRNRISPRRAPRPARCCHRLPVAA